MDECTRKLLFDKGICEYDSNVALELLRNKNLDKDFIAEIIEQGLTDEVTEKLHQKGFTYEEIVSVAKVLKKEPTDANSSCDCDCDCETDISTDIPKQYPESDYLKEHFGKILPTALREVLTKKPYDPIEYLGHWLLYYKECEERERRRKQLEEELKEERLKLLDKSIAAWEPPEEMEFIDEFENE